MMEADQQKPVPRQKKVFGVPKRDIIRIIQALTNLGGQFALLLGFAFELASALMESAGDWIKNLLLPASPQAKKPASLRGHFVTFISYTTREPEVGPIK
jgi:hypothetical protein